MQGRRLTVTLDTARYKVLERLAKLAHRTPEAQAAWLLEAVLEREQSGEVTANNRAGDHE